jgi:hypothetical protein
MSGDIINQAQSAFNGKPNSQNNKAKKRYPTPVCVRFTEEEKALLEAKAGDLTTSAYVRLCVLGADAPKHRTRSKKAVKRSVVVAGETRHIDSDWVFLFHFALLFRRFWVRHEPLAFAENGGVQMEGKIGMVLVRAQ